jgi:hypothetical protein
MSDSCKRLCHFGFVTGLPLPLEARLSKRCELLPQAGTSFFVLSIASSGFSA